MTGASEERAAERPTTTAMFIRNIWYVAAWTDEIDEEGVLACTVAGERIVLFRDRDRRLSALEDRCSHRWAPLSLGRVEGHELRCMYHGLKFNAAGACTFIPGTDRQPSGINIRSFPVEERWGWVWVWTGDPDRADISTIPDAWGVDQPGRMMRTGSIDYEADYQLINDNLCDLSHVDFVHERTLRTVNNSSWSDTMPTITTLKSGIRVERWQCDHIFSPDNPKHVDTFIGYNYLLPGILVMRSTTYPAGTAAQCQYVPPDPAIANLFYQVEQQAVTPIADGRTRYLFGSGFPFEFADAGVRGGIFEMITEAFAEDRRMIEGQQQVWRETDPDDHMAFIPQDRGPSIFRRLIKRRLNEEAAINPASA